MLFVLYFDNLLDENDILSGNYTSYTAFNIVSHFIPNSLVTYDETSTI